MYPNQSYRKGESAEQYTARLLSALEIQKKKVLEARCRLLDDNIKELAENLQEVRQENCQLTEKCSTLEIQIVSLEKKLKDEKQEGDRLKERNEKNLEELQRKNCQLTEKCASLKTQNYSLQRELENEEQYINKLNEEMIDSQKAIKDCNKIINAKKKEVLRYKADLERLKQKDASNEITDKISKIYQRFVNVNEVISTKSRTLAVEINTHHRAENEEHLLNLQFAYEYCNQSLRSRNVFPTDSQFTELLEEYKTLCEGNDCAAKDMLKTAYNYDKSVKDMRQRWETFVKHHADDLEKLGQFEKNNVIPDATLLKRKFQKETQLYDDIVAVADEEITRKEDMLHCLRSKACNSQSRQKGFNFDSNWSNDETEEQLQNNSDYVTYHPHNDHYPKKEETKKSLPQVKKNSK